MAVDSQGKRAAFRRILASPGGEVCPGAYDVLSALLIEQAGFRVVHIANSSVHHSLGFADVGLLTVTEQVALATRVAEAVSIPVIADCEMPGTTANVARAARDFERSGVAAIDIEDEAVLGASRDGGRSAVPSAVFVDWIKAAADARVDPSFCIVARMENRGEPYDRVLERGRAAASAGADALWIGHLDEEETRRIVRDVPKPMVGIQPRPRIPQDFLAMGYKLAMIPSSVAQAACWAWKRTCETSRKAAATTSSGRHTSARQKPPPGSTPSATSLPPARGRVTACLRILSRSVAD